MIAFGDASEVGSRFAGTPRVSVGAVTVKGTHRPVNEDRYFIDPAGHYFLVADGMGGMDAGEVASGLACRMLSRQLDKLADQRRRIDWPGALRRALSSVNDALLTIKRRDTRLATMGTTVVAAVFEDWRVYIAWLGDSRGYLVRARRAVQLTVDHSLAQALATAGAVEPAAVARHPWRNALWKYLGCPELENGADVRIAECRPGDGLILATDGLTDRVPLRQLADVIARHDDPQRAVRELLETAIVNGATDDITCVLAYLDRSANFSD